MKKLTFSDIFIIVGICVFVAGIMLVSFAAKAIKYEQVNDSVTLTVQKKVFTVYAETNGILASSSITVGQHVRKGDIIGQLSNESLDKEISALSAITSDPSAAVQLSQLEVEKAAQTLYSPTDGVVASTASQGDNINDAEKVATIYSDNAVQLVGRFSYSNYNLFQQNTSNLTAISLRTNQTYEINYGGTFQEVSTDQNKNSYVTLFFTFASPNDAANVLQNEQFIMKIDNTSGNTRPIDYIVNLFRNSIFNTNQ